MKYINELIFPYHTKGNHTIIIRNTCTIMVRCPIVCDTCIFLTTNLPNVSNVFPLLSSTFLKISNEVDIPWDFCHLNFFLFYCFTFGICVIKNNSSFHTPLPNIDSFLCKYSELFLQILNLWWAAWLQKWTTK